MKERGILFSGAMVRALLDGTKTQTRRAVKGAALGWLESELEPEFVADRENGLCPYGQPGDRLWVRETWAPHPDFPETTRRGVYRADPECKYDVARWRPSIHMPRWASRILLEIVSVRVERLQDISEADALAEDPTPHPAGPVCAFSSLWRSINGVESWVQNPWVWVVEFRRIEQ